MPWRKGNRLRVVTEADATGSIQETYEDIKGVLGLPHVALMHQALACYPVFFRLHWQSLRPAVFTRQFFALADRLRADAYTRVFNYLEVPALATGVDANVRRELMGATELLQYRNPVLLLIVAAQLQTLDGPIGRNSPDAAPPPPAPSFETAQPLDEQQAPAPVRRIYEDIRRTLDVHFVSYYYRVLGRWPEFLREYWTLVKGLATSPMYEGIQHAIRDSAWSLTRELPAPIELTTGQLAEAGMTNDEIASVARILELFVNSLSSSVLNVALGRIALEGGNRPAASEATPEKKRAGTEKAA